ncbi:MAG: PIN domain-containing protein, partial [Ignavibacteriae bacterium]|nr:PIN domain-containing protein [Ignavibacteriota bacterium]
MRVVVDANIVFSAILNAKGKIGDILINHSHKCDFIAPDFLRIEISKYHGKLSKISGLTIRDILESEYQIFKNIKFISEEQILQTSWNKAVELVKDIDE